MKAWRLTMQLWTMVAMCALVRAGELPATGSLPASTSAGALAPSYDVVIAGAGTGGVGAAIQAARMGASVLLLEETDWIGGQMLAAAVTAMDEGGAGNLVRGRGLYREFLERIDAYYRPLGLDPFRVGTSTNTRFEPRVGRQILHAMLREAGSEARLDLLLRARVVGVMRERDTVTGVAVEYATARGLERKKIASRILIDATEWGDVLPLTGARYRIGNRTDDALDRSRLVQDNTWTAVIKRYPDAVPPVLRLAAPPPGYNERRKAFAASIVPGDAPRRQGTPMSWKAFLEYRGMPNSAEPGKAPQPVSRTHLNFSNDYPSTVAYLEDPAQRVAVNRAMRLRTLQLLYYLQHDLGHSDWSVADDEGFDSPYNREQIDAWLKAEPKLEPYRQVLYQFSTIPYVRESRRIVGLYTLRAREISRGPGRHPIPFPTAIALGDYRLDLHGGRSAENLELDLDQVSDLEDIQPGRAGPFAIPMECLVPEKIDGLLAAEKNFSQTRLVNGATRMQPHTMNIGQAVGALAALAVRHGVPPRQVNPVLVQRALLDARDTLDLTPLRDVPQRNADWPAIQLVALRGLIALDNGWFHPSQPLRNAELAPLLTGLGAKTVQAADAVTRAVLAQALAAIAPARVRVDFTSSEAEAARPVTRSEAAQVAADYLEFQALAEMTHRTQTLAWNSVRPSSISSPAEAETPAAHAIRQLVDAHLLSNPDYWLEHAAEGKTCDGGRVAEVMQRAARLIEPTAAAGAAVEVMARARVITSREYWTKSAVPGGTCSGRNVALLLHNLAQNEAVHLAASQ